MMMKSKLSTLDASIFRAYDIRGIAGTQLTENTVYFLGRALGSLVIEQGEKQLAMGRDGRLSSPKLSKALCEGILESGCDVINIGLVPTPLLYYATHILDTGSGVMLTGSHNPAEYNGLKMVIGGKTLSSDAIQNLRERVLKENFREGRGHYYHVDMIQRYIRHICHTLKLERPLKIVIDAGNGVAGEVAPQLYRQLGCEVHELYCEVDGHFPHHHPDPSEAKNLVDLIQAVKHHKADVGLAFDGDGDRLGVVTSRGEVIAADRLMMLFAKAVLAKNPAAKVIYDVKCTSHLKQLIQSLGGEPIMWKTGHSLIKAKLAETHALLAGEMSGHIFFKDRWFGFDDASYAGARLLELLSAVPDAHQCFESLPDSVNTPELKLPVADVEKKSIMDQLIQLAHFPAATISTLDGLHVHFQEGWGLVRPSNTTPYLTLRFEANHENALTHIQNLFRDLLLKVNPAWVLPF